MIHSFYGLELELMCIRTFFRDEIRNGFFDDVLLVKETLRSDLMLGHNILITFINRHSVIIN